MDKVDKYLMINEQNLFKSFTKMISITSDREGIDAIRSSVMEAYKKRHISPKQFNDLMKMLDNKEK
jgi:hypothetical protein